MIRNKMMALAMLGAAWMQAPAHAGTVNEENGIAIQGYDPVAYFTDDKAVKGSAAHTFVYDGATYEFASAAHRDAFAADPEKYAPQFGGFCAYGAAVGRKAVVDPTAFSIVDGKLYLNYDDNVRSVWRKDEPGYIHRAEQAWPTVSRQDEVQH